MRDSKGKWNWTSQEVDMLVQMANDGVGYADIAKAVGHTSKNAVAGKVAAMKMKGRITRDNMKPSTKQRATEVVVAKKGRPPKLPTQGQRCLPVIPDDKPAARQKTDTGMPPLPDDLVEAVVTLRAGYHDGDGKWIPGHCKWIEGSVRDRTAFFCGAPTIPSVRGRGGCYCKFHARRAVNSIAKKLNLKDEMAHAAAS